MDDLSHRNVKPRQSVIQVQILQQLMKDFHRWTFTSRQMRAFLLVAEYGSFTRAADTLLLLRRR